MIRYGRHTYADGDPRIHSYAAVGEVDFDITVGAYCSIAADVEFMPGGMHDMASVSTYPLFRLGYGQGAPTLRGPIRIGNDVWICRGVKILGGVTVGDGAILGAWTTVASDVPAYHVAIGNPARLHPRKPHIDFAEAFARIAWWDWPDGDPRIDHVRTMTPQQFADTYGVAPPGNR